MSNSDSQGDLLRALKEVLTHGEWRGGPAWVISMDVYEMALEAVEQAESDPALQRDPRSEWREIASAPTDGTRILGYWANYPLVQIVCVDSDGCWMESNGGRSSAPPDGWMPLPFPPSDPTKDSE